MFIGASLSIGGFVFQKVLNNKLADPYILGVASGSNLFISFAIIFSGSLNIYFFKGMAFTGGLSAVLILFLFSRFLSKIELVFILIGVSLSFIFSAFNRLLLSYADGWKVLKISSFMLGNFEDIGFKDIFFIAILFFIIFFILRFLLIRLEIISTGIVFSENVGLNYGKWSLIFLLLVSFLVAGVTSVVGVIPFVGLFVPNLVELLDKQSSFKQKFYMNVIFGAFFMLFVLSLSGILSQNIFVPVGAISALFGAPFIIFVLYKKYRVN